MGRMRIHLFEFMGVSVFLFNERDKLSTFVRYSNDDLCGCSLGSLKVKGCLIGGSVDRWIGRWLCGRSSIFDDLDSFWAFICLFVCFLAYSPRNEP